MDSYFILYSIFIICAWGHELVEDMLIILFYLLSNKL